MQRAPVVTTPAETNAPVRALRVWPAILTLYLLAPITGELLSLNTPPLTFLLNPGTFIFEPALYGSGALLIREIARRRGLGWPGILLLGAAYGVVEEGVFIQTWFIPSGVDTYGRAFSVNWVWAMGLTVFHAVFSIAIPILLTESIFPQVADRPWLGRAGRWLFGVWFGFTVVFGAVAYGFFLHRSVGYSHPPGAYVVAIVAALAFALAGLRMRPAKPVALAATPPATPIPAPSPRRPPGLWALRIVGFFGTVAYLAAFYGLGAWRVPAPLVIVALAGVVALVAWRVVRWSARRGWGAPQRLALGSGALAVWLAITPVAWATGLPLVGLAFLALLIWLAIRAASASAVTAHETAR